MKNRLTALGLCLVIISSLLGGCGLIRIKVPDISNVDEASAKSLLAGKGLIPTVEYEYDDTVAEGNVIRTSPAIGESVCEDDAITIYISKGPRYAAVAHSTIHWYDGDNEEWDINTLYIQENTLYIECQTTFAYAMTWKDENKYGYGFGNASINDTFDKTVPVLVRYKKQSLKKNETQSFTIEIPLTELGVSRPTNMYLELVTTDGDVKVDFTMTW